VFTWSTIFLSAENPVFSAEKTKISVAAQVYATAKKCQMTLQKNYTTKVVLAITEYY